MELKVWVEGVVRVVSGLSLNTSCQDVVIALAQAIGKSLSLTNNENSHFTLTELLCYQNGVSLVFAVVNTKLHTDILGGLKNVNYTGSLSRPSLHHIQLIFAFHVISNMLIS